MTTAPTGEVTTFINDVDGVLITGKNGVIGDGDCAMMQVLDDHDIRRVHASSRGLRSMTDVFMQSGCSDAVLDGGATIVLGGAEVEERRQWLSAEVAGTVIDAVLPQAHYIGYNGQRMQESYPSILRDQPPESSPSIFFTFEVLPETVLELREEIKFRLVERKLGDLLVEFNPYYGSDTMHYAQIALADKAKGIERFQEMFGLTIAECAGIGDGEPDIGIFARTAMRFAMGNSVPALVQSGYPHRQVRSVRRRGYSQAARIILNHNRSLSRHEQSA